MTAKDLMLQLETHHHLTAIRKILFGLVLPLSS